MESYAKITTVDGDTYEIRSSDPDVLKSVSGDLVQQIGPFKLESIHMKMKKRGWTCCNDCNTLHRFLFSAKIHRRWIQFNKERKFKNGKLKDG